MKKINSALMAVAITLLPGLSFAGCGSAFCTVNTSWTNESAMTEAGSTLDLRYETINQNQRRSGSRKINAATVTESHQEIATRNDNLIASYTHNFNNAFGISVLAPLMNRDHSHIHDPQGEAAFEQWRFTRLGDVRVLGRYRLPQSGDPQRSANMGMTLGFKLPTGSTSIVNAEGELAERSLQPGTGTTDIIIGAYYFRKSPDTNGSWFAQTQYQHALNHHDDYQSGDSLSVDLGYRHELNQKTGLLLQTNFLSKQRDNGAQAEPTDSGGKFVYISPGLSYLLSNTMQLQAYLQLPVYQYVNGIGLTASKSFVVGLSQRF